MGEHDWNKHGSRRLMLDDGDGDGIEWETDMASAKVGSRLLVAAKWNWYILDVGADGHSVEVAAGSFDDGNNHERCKREAIEALHALSPKSRASKLLERIEALQAEHAALVGGAK